MRAFRRDENHRPWMISKACSTSCNRNSIGCSALSSLASNSWALLFAKSYRQHIGLGLHSNKILAVHLTNSCPQTR